MAQCHCKIHSSCFSSLAKKDFQCVTAAAEHCPGLRHPHRLRLRAYGFHRSRHPAQDLRCPADQSGLYIYRDSFVGQALKKSLTVDGQVIGETAKGVYFHRFLAPGKHVIGTESEFSDNTLTLVTEPGKNYYLRQYIKMGAFVGGANLEQISEEQAQRDLKGCCKLAASK